jgi:pimeloyl-ACP methyl ester carboxylesterase
VRDVRGEPLIVLHGAYMNIPAMGAIIPGLAATHRVYALELQGHGRTTDIDRPPHLTDDVAAFMDAVGLAQLKPRSPSYMVPGPPLPGSLVDPDVRVPSEVASHR